MPRGVDLGELFAEHLLRRPAPVRHHRVELTFHDQEGVRIVSGRGESLIEQLQRALQVGRRRAALHAVFGEPDERRGRHQLAGEQLLEVGRLQAAGAGELHERRRQRGIGVVGRRRQRRSAWRGQREQHLIVLEIGRLQPRFDAVRQLQDGDADASIPSAFESPSCRSRR